MQFIIDGIPRKFTPVKVFRAEHNLPPEFGANLFEPKDFTGLGSIEHAGAALNDVREAILNNLPAEMRGEQWLLFLPGLISRFEDALYSINNQVGLRDVEISFAVAGFADMCQAFAYALLRGRHSGIAPTFEQVYGEWLNESIRVSGTVHTYVHPALQDEVWSVRLITHAYGRAGMIIETGLETCYVYDGALSCPAEGYMARLLADVTAHMLRVTVW